MTDYKQLPLYALINFSLTETPFKRILNNDVVQGIDDNDSNDLLIAKNHDYSIREQYKWLLDYSNNMYLNKKKEIFENETSKNVLAKNKDIQRQNKYYESLIIHYIKNFLFNDIDDSVLETIEFSNRNTLYSDNTNINQLFYEILYKYFENKLSKKILFEKNSSEPPLKDIKSNEIDNIDSYVDIVTTIDPIKTNEKDPEKKRVVEINNLETIEQNLSRILSKFPKELQDDLDFKNNIYIIDQQFNELSNKTVSNSTDDFYYSANKNNVLEYPYNRLQMIKNIVKNKEKNDPYLNTIIKNIEEEYATEIQTEREINSKFMETFNNIDTKLNVSDSKFTNNTLEYKFAIILNSLNNRNTILTNYYHIFNNILKNTNEDKANNITLTQVYPYLSRAFISYYKTIINNIYSKLVEKPFKPTVFKSLTISLIMYRALFNCLYEKTLKDTDIIDLKYFNDSFSPGNMLLNDFFVELKPFLDQYKKSNNALKVKVFCKINDYTGIIDTVYDPQIRNKVKEIIEYKDIDKRIFSKNKNNDNALTIVKKGATSNIVFNKVFDTATNNIVASYMAISNSLENLEGTILYTFGASGTGKSYTLFGAKGVPGVVQSAIQSLSNVSKISIKIFEIYGQGFNDNSYWESKNENNIFEKYILHNIKLENNKFKHYGALPCDYNDFINIKDKNNISEDNFIQNYSTLVIETDDMDIKSLDFEDLIDTIDNKRKEGINFNIREKLGESKINNRGNTIFDYKDKTYKIKTVKPTANNPVSSRSILVYEFIITKKVNSSVIEIPLIIVDMPGKEIISNSYNCQAPRTSIFKVVNPSIYKNEFCDQNSFDILSKMKTILYNKRDNINMDQKFKEGAIKIYKKISDAFKNKEFFKLIKGVKNSISSTEKETGLVLTNTILVNKLEYLWLYKVELGFKENSVEITLSNLIDKFYTNLINYAKANDFVKDILSVETNICKINENDYGYLPGNLALNLIKYSTNTIPLELVQLFNYVAHMKDDTPLNLYKNMCNKIKIAYDRGNYASISTILKDTIGNYYNIPYKLKDNNSQAIKDFYDEIFEGLYINENINGVMDYMFSLQGITSSIEQNNSNLQYTESNIFKKDTVVIKKLFDYYNFSSFKNKKRAVLENYISFFLCANISKNEGIKSALEQNVELTKPIINPASGLKQTPAPVELTNTNYYKQLDIQQIRMFDDIQKILEKLITVEKFV